MQIEDEENDVLLLRHCLPKAGINGPVRVACTGQQAIDYLAGEGPFANRSKHPLPDLVLLDLRMPGLDGFDVLRWIRNHPKFAALKVVVFSLSNLERDVAKAYDLGADSYAAKPFSMNELVSLLEDIKRLFLENGGQTGPGAPGSRFILAKREMA